MYIAYSLLLAFALLLSLPWWIFQVLRSGKYRVGLAGRLGWAPQRLKDAAKPGAIWVHAVSVGEVLAVTNLVRELQAALPKIPVVISTTTLTGQYLARGRFGESSVFFWPIDLGFAVRPYLDLLQPRLLVLAETEFWPNLLHLMAKRGAAIAVVNARVSDRSFPRYRRFRWFFRPVLSKIDLLLAQTEEDARRLIEIGASPGRVRVSGNLKFDVRPGATASIVEELREAFPQDMPVIVCGSTTEGEEELLLKAFQEVAREYPAAVMVLAPRHPERFDGVADLLTTMGITFLRRSAWVAGRRITAGVFLLDSVGELAAVYALARVAFVGGSLLPMGGHNILEPAQHGVAVMTGPYTFNFREIMRIFVEGRAVRVVSAQNLTQELLALLRHPQECAELGSRARDLFARHTGATEKTLEALLPLLKTRGAAP